MSVTVSEIDVPRSAVSTTGKASARASASRSRRSWVRSFRAWAMIRRMAAAVGGGYAAARVFPVPPSRSTITMKASSSE